MVWCDKIVSKVKKPQYTYGVRLYICPHCSRKQHMKADDSQGAIIKCTSCYGDVKVLANSEVEDNLYDCRAEKG